MAFRKTAYAKVFVDETIPSFLMQREEKVVPMAAPVSPILPEPAPAPEARAMRVIDERRNQPMRLEPRFMAMTVLVAIILNASLYTASHMMPVIFSPATNAPTQSAPIVPPDRKGPRQTLDDRIVSYTNPAIGGND